MMRSRFSMVGGCALLAASLLVQPARAGALHAFATGNEGWQVVDYPYYAHAAAPALGVLPFDGGAGNPAGSVRVGDVYYATGIAAPADHLGNQSSIYGSALTYDILIRYSDNTTYPAVVLNAGTKSLYYDAPPPALGVWETRVVPLTEAGWKVNGTNVPATQNDFLDVLSNLVGIYIYTEWHTGTDDTSVDNISLPVGGPVGVPRGTPSADAVVMQPAFPNPTGGETSISFALGQPDVVTMEIFDVRGRKVRTLAADRFVADRATLAWDGRSDAGEEVPSGVYLARVATRTGRVAVERIVRVR